MKLNLGSGAHTLSGYHNLDRRFGQEIYPLQYSDESCDEVRASHVLEHFPAVESAKVLQEWVRVLKPGGWLKIAVPDFKWICEEYLKGETDAPIAGYCMGGQTDENDYHKAIFDWEGLKDAFLRLGLTNIQRWESEIQDCAKLPVSLNIMGQKPEAFDGQDKWREQVWPAKSQTRAEIKVDPNSIFCVLSMPRLAFTDNLFCVAQHVSSLGIPVYKHTGVFWGQSLTNLMQMAIESGAKYVLTIDYDTLFTRSDLFELIRLMETENLDAVFPMQVKREHESPLFTVTSRGGEPVGKILRSDLERDTFDCASGHFGLTLLRLDKIAALPKPWFHSVPNEAGEWGDGRMDEDVAFWHHWKQAGHRITLAPKVVVGHMQVMASWPDSDLQTSHQYMGEYNKSGKPPWAWK